MGTVIGPDTIYFGTFKPSIQKKASSVLVGTPTFSQAFKWFREKYNIDGLVQIEPLNIKYGYVVYQRKINSFVESKRDFSTYEEAELACLRKLIQLVKTK